MEQLSSRMTIILILALSVLSPLYGESLENKQVNDESPPILARTADLSDFDLDLTAEESMYDLSGAPVDAEPRFKMPFSYAFNGGKPFSLEKDPITGKIDFEKAPPLKALNYTHKNDEEVSEDFDNKDFERRDETDVEPNEINPYSSLHDFLNLPVHYSSDRYDNNKFPLISNSYANTKVQSGSSSYSISNHRPFHDSVITPFYEPSRKVYVPKVSSTSSPETTVTTAKPTTTTTNSPKIINKNVTSTKMNPVPPSTRIATSFSSASTPMTPVSSTNAIVKSSTTTTTTVAPTSSSSSTQKYSSMIEEIDRMMASSTTSEVKITTWKPTVKVPNQYDDYENSVLKGQHSNIQTNNEIKVSSNTPLIKDEYDGYEDYEVSQEEDYNNKVALNKTMPNKSNEEEHDTSVRIDHFNQNVTTPNAAEQMMTVNAKKDSVVKTEADQIVTSIPVTNTDTVYDSINHDNVVHGQRPDLNMATGHIRFPGNGGFERPILVESTSNIIVRPDQDTVSFVLGNRQNVEDVYYTHDMSHNENSYEDGSFKPLPNRPGNGNGYHTIIGSDADHSSVGLPSISVESAFNYQPEKWYQQPPKLNNEVNEADKQISSVNINDGAVVQQQKIEHIDEKNDDNKKPFIPFSNANKNYDGTRPVEEHIVVINEADGTVQEITSSSLPPPLQGSPGIPMPGKDNMAHRIIPNAGLPQLSENLTPPERPKPSGPAQRPSFYYHYRPVGTSRPEFNRPQKMPPPSSPSRIKPNIQEPLNFKRRPLPQDTKLPNILPQFRPNSKASHGHRNPDIIGTLPAPQSYGNRRSPPPPLHMSRRPTGPPATSILQRLSPPPLPAPVGTHHNTHIRIPPAKEDTSLQNSDVPNNRFRQPAINVPIRDDDRTRFQIPKQKVRLDEEQLERFSVEPPQIPPRPVLFPKHRTNDHIPRIATLQMIQQRSGLNSNIQSLAVGTNVEDKEDVEDKTNVTDIDTKKDNSDKAPVYVVYPVNTALNIGQEENQDKEETVVLGTSGPHKPLPPDTLQQEEEMQQDIDNKKHLMMVLPVRPHSHGSPPVMASDFPYPLERPDPSLLNANPVREKPLLTPKDPDSNKHASNEDIDGDNNDNSSVNVIPYLQDFIPFAAKKNHISATLQKLPSSTPIAYVYTPTAQTLTHRADIINKEDDFIYDRSDEKPILLPSQQPSSSSSSAPSPQNFMAPFVASMSVEAPAKNGWSVVVVNSGDKKNASSVEEKISESALPVEDSQTEQNYFDPDNFKPQLFSGFQPLYEFPNENENENDEVVHLRTVDSSPDIPRTIRKK